MSHELSTWIQLLIEILEYIITYARLLKLLCNHILSKMKSSICTLLVIKEPSLHVLKI